MDLVPWAAALKLGTRRIFGFLQVDIARHSSLPGSGEAVTATRGNLHAQVRSILRQHEAQELLWAGDGGAYLFLLDAGTRVDSMVVGALQVLDSMRLFNSLSSLNLVGVPLKIRVSCHVGGAIWDPNLTNFYGRDVNYFLKAEREIGQEDHVALTEEAYNDIVNTELRELFTAERTHHQYTLSGRRYERDVYMSRPIDAIVRDDVSLLEGDPPTASEIATCLRTANRVDLFMAGGDSFFRSFYEALRLVGSDIDPDLRVRVLLRRSSLASARSATRFRSLAPQYGISVDVVFYDWDFMLRGYGFGDTTYFSYYLREGNVLSGRYNPMAKLGSNKSGLEDFLVGMFRTVFNSYFDDPPAYSEAAGFFVEE